MASEQDDEVDIDVDTVVVEKKSFLKRLATRLAWLLVALSALALSAWLHLFTSKAREVGAEVLNDYASGEMRGSLDIARFDALRVRGFDVWGEASDVELLDPEGRVVLHAERVFVRLDLSALGEGRLHFTHGRVVGGEAVLYEDEEGIPSFIHAFEAADPSDDPPAPDALVAIVDDLHVEDFVVRGDVLGLEGLRVESLRAHGRLLIDSREQHPLDIRVYDGAGQLVAPFPYEATLDRIVGRVRDDPEHGTRFHVQAHTDEDRVRANVAYRVPDGGSESGSESEELDLLVLADPVHLERLAESGLGFAEPFAGPVRGYVRLWGPTDELEIRADLETEGGPVRLEGDIPTVREGRVRIHTPGLELDRVLPGAPPIELQGTFEVATGESADVVVELEPFVYEGIEVPATRVQGQFDDDGFAVTRATTDVEGGGQLVASGRVDYDGSIDLRVDGNVARMQREPNLRALAPGLSGSVRFGADVRYDESGELDVDGRWVFQNVRYGPVRARRLVAAGRVSGDAAAPRLRLALTTQDVFVSDVGFGSGSGRIGGGPQRYTAHVDVRHPDRSVAFDANGTFSNGVARLDVGPVVLASGEGVWRGSVQGLLLTERALEVASFAFANGPQRITGSGRWQQARARDDTVHLEATGVDLALLTSFMGDDAPDIGGIITGSADIGGDLEAQPTIDVDITFEGGRILNVGGVDGSLLARYANGDLQADAGLIVQGGGELDVELRGAFDTETRLRDAYEMGAYGAVIRLNNFDLSLLASLGVEGLPDVNGRAGGIINASGALDIFDFHGQIDVPALSVAEFPAVGVSTTFAYEDGAIVARLITRDDAGDLLEAEGSVLMDIASLLEEPELLIPMLDVSPWRIAMRVPPRELGTLPAPIAEQIPGVDALRGSATFTMRGGAYQPHADLLANVEYAGELRDALCGTEAAPRATITGTLRGSRADAEVVGFLGAERVLHVEAHAQTPLERWLHDPTSFEPPSTSVRAYVVNAPLQDVPGACVYASGPLSANLEVDNLFAEGSSALLEIFSEQVAARRLETYGRGARRRVVVREETPPSQLRVAMELGNGALTADGAMAWWNGGETTFAGEVPVTWGGPDGFMPQLETDAPLNAWAELVGMPVSVGLTWLTLVSEVEGELFGSILAEGALDDPTLGGEVELVDGRVEIPSIGQHLEDVGGTFLFEDDLITFQGLRVRDGDGVALVAGDIALDRFTPRRGTLRLQAQRFPIRQEGSVLAMLDGDASLETVFEDNGLDGSLVVRELAVRLAEDLGRTPQDLAPHPDVRVLGRDRAPPPEDPYRIALHVDATDPIEVKHEDFAADASARLEILYADPLFEVTGAVTLGEGHFDVFGKRFNVERGAMVFDAEHPLDPEVNLSAVYVFRSSETVTVSASGRLSDPIIRFSSSVTNDRGEIIAMLVSGDVRRETDTDLERAPTDFLVGIAAGVLTLSLREQFGALIPTISLETNEFGGTQVRTGWRLEDHFPERIRRVIQGAYIEGFFNTRSEDGSSERTLGQVQDFGFRLEVAWPRNIVNSATYSPPTNFSLDVTVEP